MSDHVRLVSPDGPALPIVATIPHGGRSMPAPFDVGLSVEPTTLWADWYTTELYGFLPELGVTTIVTDLSRFVADPNRDPASGNGDFWKTVVPANDPMGEPVRSRPLTDREVAASVAAAHSPFHRLLDGVVAELLAQFGRVLVIDLHSFGVPLDVDVVVGDAHGTTCRPAAVAVIEQALQTANFTTARNLRFSGGWLIRRFGTRSDVDAVALELNQRRYLPADEVDAWPGVPAVATDLFRHAQHELREAMSTIAASRS